MKFANDDEVISYVNRQLSRIRDLPNGPFYVILRPQWRYEDLPAQEMDVGHLEWKIYRKSDAGELGGDRPSPSLGGGMGGFGYWALRVTSDYRFFFFEHGNSSIGADFFQLFDHGSLLDASIVTEEGEYSLSRFVEHILSTRDQNHYYLS